MHVKQFRTGGDRNFGYLAADIRTKKALIVDPSYSPSMIVNYAQENDFAITYIFITHYHYDHTQGNSTIEKLTKQKALLYGDIDPTTGVRIEDGAIFPLGDLKVTIIHTPGHTNDSICIHVDDALFSGDTLFVGKVGGTDFGGNASKEYDSLHNKLLILPDSTRVFPGHDYGTQPESTIAHERTTNPFLLQPDFKAFVFLKKNWAAYKREHGIS
ncbi:MAG: hydroxyacylglutathione hydrolase family protein [bacterium]